MLTNQAHGVAEFSVPGDFVAGNRGADFAPRFGSRKDNPRKGGEI